MKRPDYQLSCFPWSCCFRHRSAAA